MEPARIGILGIGTAVPPYEIRQSEVCRWMCDAFDGDVATVRRIRNIYAQSGIERRYSACEDFLQPAPGSRFSPSFTTNAAPTTSERMRLFEQEAPKLARHAAQHALAVCAQRTEQPVEAVRDSITHLVVVTCTGFFAPGLDNVLARMLGLDAAVRRTIIGFMGCAAAFNGLRTASEIATGRPDARVLVVCVELCSLHIQASATRTDLVVASLFGDGAAACVVGASPVASEVMFEFGEFHSRMLPDTTDEMAWHIGDHGFSMQLSPTVPKHIERAAPGVLLQLFEAERPQFWAIHPGGRAIVDRLERCFELVAEDIASTRAVLRDIGNVSSATILFVLDALRRDWEQQPHLDCTAHKSGVAMAFGPGLVVEAARLTYHPGLPAMRDLVPAEYCQPGNGRLDVPVARGVAPDDHA